MVFGIVGTHTLRGWATVQSSELAFTPEKERVAQTFGHQPLIWASFLLVVALFCILRASGPVPSLEIGVGVSCLIVTCLLIAYSVRRHRRRIVLVRDGINVAIYRRGRLDLTVAIDTLQKVKIWSSGLLHWGPYIAASLALLGALLVAVGATGLSRDEGAASRGDDFILLIAGLAFWASLASALWTTFACTHLGLPIGGSKWTEEILVSSSNLKAVFPDLARPRRGSSRATPL